MRAMLGGENERCIILALFPGRGGGGGGMPGNEAMDNMYFHCTV